MTDNPLSSLIQLVLLLFVIWSILAGMYVVINHKIMRDLYKENAELREKLARSEQSEPEWIKQLGWRLFDDAPSDPRMSALN